MPENRPGQPEYLSTPQLGVIYINPAGGCNLRCSHCWVNEGTTSSGTLTLPQWRDILQQASDMGSVSVKLTGGEPLIYPEITRLYTCAAELFDTVDIETNGTRRPDGFFDALAHHPPRSVSVSVDSARREIHDSFRGAEGAWVNSIYFLENLVEMGINNQVIMSISATDRQPVLDMMRLVERIGARTLKINFISPSGRGAGNSFSEKNDIRSILDFFKWIGSETPEWVLPTIPPALLPLSRLKTKGFCPVRNLLGVLPDGSYSLCGVGFSRLEMAWGRYPETSVREAWEKSPVFRNIRENLPEGFSGVCFLCMHRDSCLGNCIVENRETGGSLFCSNYLCQAAWDAGMFPETRLVDR